MVGCEEGFLEVGGNFFLSVLSASHPNTPQPLFLPQRGAFACFLFLSRDRLSGNSLGTGKFMKKEHKGKLISPCGEARQSLAFP